MAWGGNHFTPLLPMYERQFGYSAEAVDEMLAVYVLGLIPGFLVAGPVSDRYGRKRLIAFGLGCGAAASLVLMTFPSSLALMAVGRFLAGVSVAIAMVVGTSWIKELSPETGTPGLAARRATLTLTVGLGVGAGVSAALAQWAPLPSVLPYVAHLAVTLVASVVLLRAPRSRPYDAGVRSLIADLRIPAVSRRVFWRSIVPVAPWVFGAAAIAYAVIPSTVEAEVGSDAILYAGALTVITLGSGAIAQTVVPRLAVWTHGHQSTVGLSVTIIGTLLAALVAARPSVALGAFAATVLGIGYGILMVSGLSRIQSLANGDDLGGLTGVYYSLAYSGFVLPTVIASTSVIAPTSAILIVIAVIIAACLVISSRRAPTQL
ncbi:MFS transporter [Curtobacterium sp. MCBA15_012]|uniref:MFS transporter n=1 Tax=Curtobacterium sp. MCBA15_012 TaxID=1898738 RepID=UPI00111462FA|nr:MFS transporter [Curtobacterium sp. MCBA15_012]WIB01782.1 MFS transporter [Curtobacterium sp. MCBA15_012]